MSGVWWKAEVTAKTVEPTLACMVLAKLPSAMLAARVSDMLEISGLALGVELVKLSASMTVSTTVDPVCTPTIFILDISVMESRLAILSM